MCAQAIDKFKHQSTIIMRRTRSLFNDQLSNNNQKTRRQENGVHYVRCELSTFLSLDFRSFHKTPPPPGGDGMLVGKLNLTLKETNVGASQALLHPKTKPLKMDRFDC